MNNVNLIGRLTRDVEVRYTQTNKIVVGFTLAINKRKEGTNFFNCEAWGKTAEILRDYTKKGQQIAISGELDNDVYEKEGTKITKTKIIVSELTLLGKKEEGNDIEFNTIDNADDELPF